MPVNEDLPEEIPSYDLAKDTSVEEVLHNLEENEVAKEELDKIRVNEKAKKY